MTIGYKGSSEEGAGYFYCPYWPGMTDEQKKRVDWELAQIKRLEPTDIQKLIMKNASTEKDIK
jgi:hypothetical protein